MIQLFCPFTAPQLQATSLYKEQQRAVPQREKSKRSKKTRLGRAVLGPRQGGTRGIRHPGEGQLCKRATEQQLANPSGSNRAVIDLCSA